MRCLMIIEDKYRVIENDIIRKVLENGVNTFFVSLFGYIKMKLVSWVIMAPK
jgi:hypothetical protein